MNEALNGVEVNEILPDDTESPAIEESVETLKDNNNNNLAEIISKLDSLQASFDESIKYDKYKDELFDNLHKELTQYKNGFTEKVVETMAMDIIKMIDTSKKTIGVYQSKEYSEDNYKRLLGLLEGVTEDLLDILYRQSIEPYTIPNDDVDVKQQKIISIQETSDENLDNKIAVRLAEGYEKNGKVLRQERISIYKYKENEGGN